jgi:hypothetical protein
MPRMIVRRGDLERYEMLYKTFGSRILVVWDRRRVDRRRQTESRNGDERRQGERRGASPASWKALGFVVSD